MMHFYYLSISILLSLQIVEAGCGGCGPSKFSSNEKVGLLESIPDDNYVAGNVMISCGMCNFMMDSDDCRLAIKIGKNVLSVKDVGINEHGDSHAKDGYCHVIKKVYVEGIVNNEVFEPKKIESPSI